MGEDGKLQSTTSSDAHKAEEWWLAQGKDVLEDFLVFDCANLVALVKNTPLLRVLNIDPKTVGAIDWRVRMEFWDTSFQQVLE